MLNILKWTRTQNEQQQGLLNTGPLRILTVLGLTYLSSF